MAQNDKNFTGSIPDIYDALMVPLFFDAYARDMAKKIMAAHPENILETAAGSGVVTRALTPLLSDEATYHVTDLNAPMLERAKSQQPADSRIVWKQADAMALPFEDASFDSVCCQFGIMFLPDKVAGYREARRVLRPGGRFVFNVWDKIEENAFAQSVTQTAAYFFPDDPPRFMARTPHGYFDIAAITAQLNEAGFSNIDIETLAIDSAATKAYEAACAICQGTPLRNEILERDRNALDELTKEAARDIASKYGCGSVDGPATGKSQAHVFVATR